MAMVQRTIEQAPALPRAAARHLPWALFASVALLVLVGVGLLQVLQTSRAATAGYELRTLERERTQLAAEVRLLEADVASHARVEQVRRAAVERLGMVLPERSLRLAVDAPAPTGIPLPKRYVVEPEQLTAPSLPWWERALRLLPGFE